MQGLARQSGLYPVASPGWDNPKTRQDKSASTCAGLSTTTVALVQDVASDELAYLLPHSGTVGLLGAETAYPTTTSRIRR